MAALHERCIAATIRPSAFASPDVSRLSGGSGQVTSTVATTLIHQARTNSEAVSSAPNARLIPHFEGWPVPPSLENN